MNERMRKLLIIGAKGYERDVEGLRVDCFLWESLTQVTNIRDYDTVLLDLLPLEAEERRKQIDWAHFHTLFDFNAAVDILLHSGRIVFLGDPRFSIPGQPSDWRQSDSVGVPFLEWTGIQFSWDDQPGDTISFDDYRHEAFAEFTRHLHAWSYSLDSCSPNRTVISSIFPNCYVEIETDFFCRNRYRNAIAFTARLKFPASSRHGPLAFLPRISLNEEETLQLVLRDVCGVETALPEPAWLCSVAVPGQQGIDARIEKIKSAIREKGLELETANTERAQARRCLKLLYERDFGLEPVVRETLRDLGATVQEPTDKNKEDGWLSVVACGKVFEGVLEIKSTRSDQFGEGGRKQLLDWIDRGRTMRQKSYKGIFIGNSAVTKPLENRPDPFSDSWKRAAALSQICALKSEDLYHIYILSLQKKVELHAFWTQVFSTDGIFDMTPYVAEANTLETPRAPAGARP